MVAGSLLAEFLKSLPQGSNRDQPLSSQPSQLRHDAVRWIDMQPGRSLGCKVPSHLAPTWRTGRLQKGHCETLVT